MAAPEIKHDDEEWPEDDDMEIDGDPVSPEDTLDSDEGL